MEMNDEELRNWFVHHPPTEEQIDSYTEIRDTALGFAIRLKMLCPDSRERSTALSRLREVVMWANASIACNEGREES
jgi:hypothetical protein